MLNKIKQLLFGNRVRALGTIVLTILIILAGWNFFANKQSAPQYQTAQAEKGTLITTVSASGTVSSGSTVNISTQATGFIANVYVKNGDTVTQGEKIADMTLDQDGLQKQSQALSSYLSAQSSLDSAKSKMNSLQSALFKANQAFVTDRGIQNPTDQDKADPKYIEENADWLQAQADYTNQQNVINAAQASLTSSWYSYQALSSIITAPASGIISGLSVSPGASVTQAQSSSTNSNSNPSTSLGTITLPSGSLQATVDLSEIDVTHVQVGQKVTLTLDAFPDKTFTGKVTSIDTAGLVSSGVTTYPTVITFDTSDSSIYPNMAVTGKIITEVKDDVLLIPSTAIQTISGQSTVRVLKNGQVQSVDITIGDANDTDTEITSGLSEGDMVVTSVVTLSTGSRATSSPFGGTTGFGGARGGGGFGGGAVIRTGGGR